MSDTHLGRVDERFERLLAGPLGEADALAHAGDHASAEVVDHLEFVDQRPYYGVAGNMDCLAGRLPDTRVFELEGLKIGIVHGWGAPEGLESRVLAAFSGRTDVVIFGHSHRPVIKERGGVLLVNPGSAFWPRQSSIGTVALLELSGSGARARLAEVAG